MREADDDLHIAVKTSPLWRVKDDLLQSVPGVGRVVSLTLLAELSEPGRLSSKEIAALVGVVPLARDSGTLRGKRRMRKLLVLLNAMARSGTPWDPEHTLART
jgi:transposase